jgi:hypothetical protein
MALRPHDSTRAALLALLVANLLPLWGVLVGGWSVWTVLVLYWLESGIVGLYSLPRILLAAGSGEGSSMTLTINGRPVDTSGPDDPVDGLHVYPENVPIAGFFCLHYGIFWVVHGVFVLTLPGFAGGAALDPLATAATVGVAAVGLVASHGVSFATNYVGRGEYRRTSAAERMQAPYGRVVALHVTIVVGAFLVGSFGSPLPALVLLVVLKTAIDVAAHLREHRAVAPEAERDRTGPTVETPQ